MPDLAQALPSGSDRARRQALLELMESALRPAGAASPAFALDLDLIKPAAKPGDEARSRGGHSCMMSRAMSHALAWQAQQSPEGMHACMAGCAGPRAYRAARQGAAAAQGAACAASGRQSGCTPRAAAGCPAARQQAQHLASAGVCCTAARVDSQAKFCA
jgi:hypothetical protein